MAVFIKRIAALLCFATLLDPAPAAPVFPVKHAANGRYLVDQNDAPFPILGRTAWFVLSAPEAEYRTFIDDTVARGYTAIELHVLNHDPRGNNPPFNGNGDLPFLNRLDGTSWNGSFSGSEPDFTTPNEAYWSFVDGFFAYCESKGILVFFFPAYVGFQGGEQGWMEELVANGVTNATRYGEWIATRYQNQKNLVWMMGGDMGTAPNSFNTEQTEVERALLTGITNVPGQQSVQFSAEWSSESIATDQTNFGAAMTLNGVYSHSGYVAYHCRRAYAHSPLRPAFLLEEPYDEEGLDGNGFNPAATQPVRRFQWWGWLSSIGGYISGNGYVWGFRTNNATVDWHNHLDTPGSRDMARLNAFMGTIAWYKLVPSGLNGMRVLVTDGGSSEYFVDYVTAAASPDGTLLVAYLPPAHNGPITVDMGVMSGPVDARWFDPTSAVYADIGTGLTNAGSRSFTTPGDNSAGAKDWVLVLKVPVPDTTPPSAPPGLTAQAVSLHQVNLSWPPSTDDVAVACYQVERCLGANCDAFTPWMTVLTNQLADVGLPAETTVRYRVAAVDTSTNISGYSTTATATTWSPPVAWSGLVADYALDEGAGTTAADSSGQGNTGWIEGGAWTAQGKFGSALEFNSTGFLTASNSSSLNLTNGFSLEAWVYPASPTNALAIIVRKESSGGFGYMLGLDSLGRPSVSVTTEMDGARSATSPLPLAANSWTHLVGTYDGVSLEIFVNGIFAANNTATGNLVSSTLALRVGGASGGENFIGRIDGVRIYNRPLKSAEVEAVMGRASGAPPTIQLSTFPQSAAEVATNGFRLFLSADTPGAYAIEATTNFAAWEVVAIAQYTNGAVAITDRGGEPLPSAFYRLLATNAMLALSISVPRQTQADVAARGFKFIVNADAPVALIVERSTDLLNWQPVGALNHAGGAAEFTDPLFRLPGKRFYRARPN